MENREALEGLREKAELEVKHKQLLYHINTKRDGEVQDYTISKNKLEKQLQTLCTKKSELMCSFLKGFILKLDRAQVADSIVKVL